MAISKAARIALWTTAACVAAIAVWPVYISGIMLNLWQPLTRPDGVTKAARYVSLVEVGTWFDCSVDHTRNADRCRAWNSDGRLIRDGYFRLENQERAASESELRPSVADGDGGIYLFASWGILGGRDTFSKHLVAVNDKSPQP